MVSNNLAIANFERNIKSVDDLIKIHQIIDIQLPNLSLESGEILRAVIVLSVSALDNFLHDFYRTEIVDSYLGNGNFNVKFENLQISINGMKMIDNAESYEIRKNYLEQEIRKIQKTDTYQSPKSIEYIFSNLNVKNIWSQIEIKDTDRLMSAQDIKSELSNIIDRRNKISHESDWDFINEKKYPITVESAKSALDFIKNLVAGIDKIKS